MEFANKRQLNTFDIYERVCNLLFSTKYGHFSVNESTNWELSNPANFTNWEMSGLRNVRLPFSTNDISTSICLLILCSQTYLPYYKWHKWLFRTQTSIFTLKMCSCQHETRLTWHKKKHTSLIFRALASLAHIFVYLSLLKLKMDCWERNIVHFQSKNYAVCKGERGFYSHALCCLCILYRHELCKTVW